MQGRITSIHMNASSKNRLFPNGWCGNVWPLAALPQKNPPQNRGISSARVGAHSNHLYCQNNSMLWHKNNMRTERVTVHSQQQHRNQKIAHHNVLSSLMRNYTIQHSQQAIVSRFVTETSDITAEKLRNLTSGIHFVECQLQSLLTIVFFVMAKQYPGETLSSHTLSGNELQSRPVMCLPKFIANQCKG